MIEWLLIIRRLVFCPRAVANVPDDLARDRQRPAFEAKPQRLDRAFDSQTREQRFANVERNLCGHQSEEARMLSLPNRCLRRGRISSFQTSYAIFTPMPIRISAPAKFAVVFSTVMALSRL